MQQQIGLPQECYKYRTIVDNISTESNEYWEFESLDWTDKIEVRIKGLQEPLRGFVDPRILKDANVCKSLLLMMLTVSSKWYSIPAAIITLLSKTKLNDLFYHLNRTMGKSMGDWILKDRHVSDFSLELQLFIFTFLIHIGVTEENADKFAEVFVHLIEYDNAYKLRLIDIISETSAYNITHNARGEIKRLAAIAGDRDTIPLRIKIKKVSFLVRAALLVPKAKKAFIKAIEAVNINRLQYDTNAEFWVCLRTDYKFMGLAPEQRKVYAEHKGFTYINKLQDAKQ